MSTYDSEEKKVSVFNAGVAQAIRIDELHRLIAASRFSPFVMNPMTGGYGYETRISALRELAILGWAKFDENQRKLCDKFEKAMNLLMAMKPIIQESGGDEQSQMVINYQNYQNYLNPVLDDYAKNLMIMLDDHGFMSPDKDDYEGL